MEGRDMSDKGENSNKVVTRGPGEEGIESRSTGENTETNASKRRRHNANQIQELEAYFKKNSHPDEKERLELGTKLSMDSNQVKSWFQNKRSQVKAGRIRHELHKLKEEKEKLRIEHIALKKALANPICDRCANLAIVRDINVEELQTKLENDRLNDEVKTISAKAKNLLGPSALLQGSMASRMKNSGRIGFDGIHVADVPSPMGRDFRNCLLNPLSVLTPGNTVSFPNEDVTYDTSMLMDLASAAMKELLKLAEIDEPLWIKNSDEGVETLNLEEYTRSFTPVTGMKPGHFTTEATRASGVVIYDSLTLVETLMNKSQWVEMFSCIVGKTSAIDVVFKGVDGSKSGALLLMKTEFQIISDLVPVREIKFLRFCQRLHHEGSWAVVDVSIDTIQKGSQQCETGNCRKLPSGCIVKDMSNGYSKVTWIEHMEYDENCVHHLYRSLVKIGQGFGAQRWMSTLRRQSEFSAAMMSSVDPTGGKRSLRMLVQRMTRNFCAGVCATIYNWKIIQLENGEDTKLMMRKNVCIPGEPIGVVLSATKTIWLPMKQQQLFKFFMNAQTRSQWDVLSSEGLMQPMVHIFKGQNLNSSISLFRANGDDTNANPKNMMILQASCTDATGSLLVYATFDSLTMKAVMTGGDSSCVALLPSGVAIVPYYREDSFETYYCNEFSGKKDNGFSCGGSLVTIGFQVLVNSSPVAQLSTESIKTVNDLISRRIHGIRTALKC